MRRSSLLDLAGAVAAADAADPDALVPAHYGSPLREQNRLEAGGAVSALARDVVAVRGPDRLSWLTTLSSQVLTGLTPGDGGAETLLMDAQGHITHALAALDDGETLYLVTEAGDGPDLAQFLDSMRFMLRVEVMVREDLVVLGAIGEGLARLAWAASAVAGRTAGGVGSAEDSGDPQPADEAARADREGPSAPGGWILTWRDPWPGVCEGGTSYDVGLGSSERPFRHPGERYQAGFMIVDAGRLREVVDAFAAQPRSGQAIPGQASPAQVSGRTSQAAASDYPGTAAGASARLTDVLAGSLAWEALRVEAGRPRLTREVDERTIPHELDWLRTAIHLTKGCYPGQETVARTLNLGRPPRRLAVLQLDGLGGELPAPGATVRMGERAVGHVTSVARHHDYGPIALALLRRAVPLTEPLTVAVTETDEVGEVVETGRVDAAQEALVSPEGKAQASPAQRPGAGLRSPLLRPGAASQ